MSYPYESGASLLRGDESNSKDFATASPGVANSRRRIMRMTAICIGIVQLALFILYGVTGSYWKMVDNQATFSAAYTLFLVRLYFSFSFKIICNINSYLSCVSAL
jgi:hypothetical protein